MNNRHWRKNFTDNSQCSLQEYFSIIEHNLKWLVLSNIIMAPLYPQRNIFQAGRIRSRNTDCRPHSAISQLNFRKTSQTDVLFQQLFQTGITLIHHWCLERNMLSCAKVKQLKISFHIFQHCLYEDRRENSHHVWRIQSCSENLGFTHSKKAWLMEPLQNYLESCIPQG